MTPAGAKTMYTVYDVDHIISLKQWRLEGRRGDVNDPSNLQCLCLDCHRVTSAITDRAEIRRILAAAAAASAAATGASGGGGGGGSDVGDSSEDGSGDSMGGDGGGGGEGGGVSDSVDGSGESADGGVSFDDFLREVA